MRCTVCFKSLLLFIVCLMFACNKTDSHVIARVNTYPISDSELNFWALQRRAEVHNYFYTEFGINDSEDFWQQKQEGESPLEMLYKLAFEKAVRCKVQQVLAYEKGVIEQIGFHEIMLNMAAKNKENDERINQGHLVYGLKKFSSRTYFSHVFDKMIIELKEELGKSELKLSETELAVLSLQNKSALKNNHSLFQKQYVDENYNAFVDSLVSVANVEINEKQLNRFKVNFK